MKFLTEYGVFLIAFVHILRHGSLSVENFQDVTLKHAVKNILKKFVLRGMLVYNSGSFTLK